VVLLKMRLSLLIRMVFKWRRPDSILPFGPLPSLDARYIHGWCCERIPFCVSVTQSSAGRPTLGFEQNIESASAVSGGRALNRSSRATSIEEGLRRDDSGRLQTRLRLRLVRAYQVQCGPRSTWRRPTLEGRLSSI
jgi:hypothetical protein